MHYKHSTKPVSVCQTTGPPATAHVFPSKRSLFSSNPNTADFRDNFKFSFVTLMQTHRNSPSITSIKKMPPPQEIF